VSAAPGWYPDPGGRLDLYRYWDGRAWSAAVSPTPAGAPPLPPPVGAAPTAAPGGGSSTARGRRRSRALGWLLALAAVLTVLVVVVVVSVQHVSGAAGSGARGQPSTPICPEEDDGGPEPQPADGRVHAGRLSYSRLRQPWSAPVPESGVAFGKGVLLQSVEIERSGNRTWLAAVLLGELVAGDGFYSPKDGAAIVVRCVSGTFYGGSAVTRDDQVDRPLTVDGHDAWVVESQLGFEVPGIRARSERLIVVVVDTGTGTSGLFYASIPENAPQLLQPARDALASLTVDG
jgi:hypothetical protein